MPNGWRPRAASEDSLRRFYDSLRTSRDTLLPAGADTARVPFAYDTTSPVRAGTRRPRFRWIDLIQDSVLRHLVDTSLRITATCAPRSRDRRVPAPQYRATRAHSCPR